MHHHRLRRRQLHRLILPLLLAALLLHAAPAAPRVQSQPDDPPAHPLLDLLNYLPLTADTRASLVYYGDLAAWHASWDVPRVATVAELSELDEIAVQRIGSDLTRQIIPPPPLDPATLVEGTQLPAYGFNLLTVDRFAYLEAIPDEVSVIEGGFDPDTVAAALSATGYEAERLTQGGTLYRVFDDYGSALELGADALREWPRVGQLGALNRIALLGERMVIGRATGVVTTALEARLDNVPAMADDPGIAALAEVITGPALDDTGVLVGAMFSALPFPDDPALFLGPGVTAEEREALLERYGLRDPANALPPYLAVAFATRHAPGATYPVLAVGFLPEVDIERATTLLADRLQTYQLLYGDAALSDYWAFERAYSVEAGGLAVAVVVMRVDDPAPDESLRLMWPNLVFRRDLLFLAQGMLPTDGE